MKPSEFSQVYPLSVGGALFSCPECEAAIYEVYGLTAAREAHIAWHEALGRAILQAAGMTGGSTGG